MEGTDGMKEGEKGRHTDNEEELRKRKNKKREQKK